MNPMRGPSSWHRWSLALTALGIVGLLAGAAGAVIAATGDVNHPEPYERSELPPPAFNRWIAPTTGLFNVPLWDDRSLSIEERRADQWYNPRWKPFAECMASAGFQNVANASEFWQDDLEALLAQINKERPDVLANRAVNTDTKLPGRPGAFLTCADQWLTLDRSEFSKYGLKDLLPGEKP